LAGTEATAGGRKGVRRSEEEEDSTAEEVDSDSVALAPSKGRDS
jgi:hypothetical protein